MLVKGLTSVAVRALERDGVGALRVNVGVGSGVVGGRGERAAVEVDLTSISCHDVGTPVCRVAQEQSRVQIHNAVVVNKNTTSLEIGGEG